MTVVARHSWWARLSHWVATASFAVLAVTGTVILMAHPRLYWGNVGNDLTPALIELPISRNYQHGGYEKSTAFFNAAGSPMTANRTYDIFNQNGWGRSLHFLSAWILVAAGGIYLLGGAATGHFRRRVVPRGSELTMEALREEVRSHLRLRIPRATGGPDYGVLQKCAYTLVVFLALPVMVVTGLAMSPAIGTAFPLLAAMFGGVQSARTIHFAAFVALVAFLVVHVSMIAKSGFTRQLRGMTFGA